MSAAALLVIATLLQGAPTGYAKSLDDGRRAFDAFDLVSAASSFERAAAFAPSPGDKAVALVWLGAIHAENADFDGARAQFRAALALDAKVPVSVNLSPAIHRLMDEERARAKPLRAAVAAPVVENTTPRAPAGGYADEALPERPRWALMSGGAVAAAGVLAVGGGAMVGLYAVTQRDSANGEAFQSDAIAEYQKARQGAMWANVLYGAGGLLVAAGGGLAAASVLGVDQ